MTIETTRAAIKRRGYGILGQSGAVLVEFALLAPVLLLLVLGMVQFGLTLSNYVMLTNAAGVGSMQFAISRSSLTPASGTWTAITNAAPTLTPANLPVTLYVGGTACLTAATTAAAAAAADTTCAGDLKAAAPSSGTLTPAAVRVTYPCGAQFTWYNFWTSTCKLTQTMTESVQ